MGEVKTSFGSYRTTLPCPSNYTRVCVCARVYVNTSIQIHSNTSVIYAFNQYAYISMWRSTFELEVLQCFSHPLHFFHLLLYLHLLLVFRFSSPASVKLHQRDGHMYGRILERITRLFLNVELSLAFKRTHGYLAHAHARCMRSSSFQQERRNWKGDFRERRLNIFSLAGCKSRSCDSGVNNGVTNTLWQIGMNILG